MTSTKGQLEAQTAGESLHSRLSRGLEAHHFVRMTEEGRFSPDKTNYECACGSEFTSAEKFRDHQALRLRVFLGIPESREGRQRPTPARDRRGEGE
jgi:hypothetical protein